MTTEAPGKQQVEEYLFELTGGALCLDLVNTVENRPSSRATDLLDSYDDLLAWGEQSCLFEEGQLEELRREAASHPSKARHTLSHARKLREALFSIFSSVASGRKLPDEPVDVLNASLPRALSSLRVVPGKKGFMWCWRPGDLSLDMVLHPAVESAADLLTSADLDRVRLCESDQCDWLFLDRSRNRSRRWCDMTVCGNRAKARRHYHRVRKTT